MDDPKIPEPIQDQVQPTDDLAIPTYLQRKLDPVAAEIKTEQDETKRLKARGRIEKMKAKKSGAMTAMPLTGKAALDAIPETDEEFLRKAADRVRMRLSRSAQDIVEIGLDLIAVKDRVGQGNFLAWIDREFRMSDQSAANFMNVARIYGDEIPNGLEFSPAVLYALAAPSTAEQVRAEITERAKAGEKITAGDVREAKERSADVKKKADRAAKKRPKPKPDVRAAADRAESGEADSPPAVRGDLNHLEMLLREIRGLVENAESPPIMSGFLRQAIHEFAKEVVKEGPETITENTRGFVDGCTWIACAKQVIARERA
jgi:hypothetical protein